MTTLRNAITIDASGQRVWAILADVGELDEYDPTVEGVEVTSADSTGVGASRKVHMADGRHWFTERLTVCEPDCALAFELTGCDFPIRSLAHSYSFESSDQTTTVIQVMDYEVKYGPIGKLMDRLVLRRQFDAGVGKFLDGLKRHAEQPE